MKVYDKHIRILLLNEIARKKEFILDPACKIVHEMDVCFGCARVDLAVINGQIHGFEIKSERDNLGRLPVQIDFYNKIFDTVTLVVSEKHCEKAAEIVPKWWGLYCISKNNNSAFLSILREPSCNKNTEPLNLTQILWKSELHELLRLYGVTKGIKSKTRYELGKIAVQKIPKAEIAAFVRNKLKNRVTWKALQLQQIYDDLHQLLPN